MSKFLYDVRPYFITALQFVLFIPFFYALTLQVPIYWWMSAFAVAFCFTVFGFNIGFHHTFCHKIFKFPRFIEIILMYIGTVGSGSSPLGWSIYHGAHHKYPDTVYDPNSPYILKWKALFMCFHKTSKPDIIGMRHLFKDPFQKYFDSNIGYWTTMLSWPILMGCIFGIKGLIFLWAIPVLYTLLTQIIFVFSHVGQPDKTGNRAINNWLLHLVSFGDGNHKDHHTKWNTCGWLPIVSAKLIGGKPVSR